MREVVITRGMDAGTHRVYTVDEAAVEGILPVPEWRRAVEGDWILTDDGFVLQCIRAGSLTESFRGIRWIRTAIGTYRNRKHDQVTTEPREDRWSFTGNHKPGRRTNSGAITVREKLFVELWFVLDDTDFAYRQAFGTDLDENSVRVGVARLLKRRRVIDYMKAHLGDVLEKHEIDKEFVIKNIKKIATVKYDPKKGHNVLPTKLRANVLLGTLVDVFDSQVGGRGGGGCLRAGLLRSVMLSMSR